MRVHDHIGIDARVGEGHVLLSRDQTHHALLTVARGELVAQLGQTHVAHHRLDQEVVVVRGRDQHLVHVAAVLLVLHRRGARG